MDIATVPEKNTRPQSDAPNCTVSNSLAQIPLWFTTIVTLLISGCGTEPPATQPYSSQTNIALGERFIFHPERLKGDDSYYFVSGKNGEFWVVLKKLMEPLTAIRISQGRQYPPETISPPNWCDTDRVCVSNDLSGNPVIILLGCVKDARNSYVVARTWIGEQWSEPAEIDHFDGTGTFGEMLVCLDSSGRIHVVYDRRLEPREEYSRGHVIAAGEFPDKCFHAYGDGQKWTKAKPTTSRGRFYVDPVSLCELNDGRVCLIVQVSEFTSVLKPEYVGYQAWDGKQWSNIGGNPPKEGTEMNAILDYLGNTLFWGQKAGQYRCILRRHGESEKNNPDEQAVLLSEPLMKRDNSGRIIVFSQDDSRGEVRLWGGKKWEGCVTFPLEPNDKFTRILTNPDGNIYLIGENKSGILIQRITCARKAHQ